MYITCPRHLSFEQLEHPICQSKYWSTKFPTKNPLESIDIISLISNNISKIKLVKIYRNYNIYNYHGFT